MDSYEVGGFPPYGSGEHPIFMGNPNRLPDEHRETFEGRPNDPRFEKNLDPQRDPRFDTHLKAGMVPPKNLGGGLWVLALVIGLVLFALVIVLMYWRFQTPSPRSPEGPQSRVEPIVLTCARSIS